MATHRPSSKHNSMFVERNKKLIFKQLESTLECKCTRNLSYEAMWLSWMRLCVETAAVGGDDDEKKTEAMRNNELNLEFYGVWALFDNKTAASCWVALLDAIRAFQLFSIKICTRSTQKFRPQFFDWGITSRTSRALQLRRFIELFASERSILRRWWLERPSRNYLLQPSSRTSFDWIRSINQRRNLTRSAIVVENVDW